MFFNPLFLQVTNSGQLTAQLNVQKMNGSSYLFSDIIKVCIDKTDTLQKGILPAAMESEQAFSLGNFLEFIFKDRNSLKELQPISEVPENNIESLINNSSVKLNKTEVHQIITDLLKGGRDFNGKVSLLLDESHLPDDKISLEKIKESPENLIALLKGGGTLLIEDPEQSKDNGLLITIVEKEVKDISNEQSTSVPEQVTVNKIVTPAEYEFKVVHINTSDILNTTEQVKEIFSGRKLNILLNNTPTDYYSSTETYKTKIPLLTHSTESTYKNFPSSDTVSQSIAKDSNNNFTPGTKINSDVNFSSEDKQKILIPNEVKILESDKDNKSKEIGPGNLNVYDDKGKHSSILSPLSKTIEDKELVKPEIPKLTDINVLEKETLNNTTPLNTKPAETIMINKTGDNYTRSFETLSLKETHKPVSSGIKVEQKINKVTAEISVSDKLFGNEFKKNIEPLKKVDIPDADLNKTIVKETKDQKAITYDELKISLIDKAKIIEQPENVRASKNISKENFFQNITIPDKSKSNMIKIREKSELNIITIPDKSETNKSEPEKIVIKNDTSIKQSEFVRAISLKEVISKGMKEMNLEKPPTEVNIKTPVGDYISPPGQDFESTYNNAKEQTKNYHNSSILKSPVGDDHISYVPEEKPVTTNLPAANEQKSNIDESKTIHMKNNDSGSDKPTASDNEVPIIKKINPDPVFRTETQTHVIQKDKTAFELFPQQNTAKVIKAAEIAKEISKFIQDGNKNSIVMKLDPENLGSVKIQLDVVNKMIHAQIEVENETTQKLVENNLNQLYNSLNQNGVQISSVNISLSNFDQKNTKNLFTRKRNQENEHEKITEDKTVIQEKNMGYNTYDYLI